MVRRGRVLAGCAAFSLMGGQAPATPPGDPIRAAEPSGATIVVTGSRNELFEAYIDALTKTRGNQQIARWNGHICPRALGLDAAHNGYLAARVVEIAKANGVLVERGACVPNILIVVTDEADRFVDLLLERHPLLFGNDGVPPTPVKQALRAPKPVRWINASAWGNADGRPLDGKNNFVYSASRLQESTRRNAFVSVVVVDAKKIEHITWRALSAYLAMVAIALPPPDLNPPDGGTILSLFEPNGSPGPADLTRWDRAYLKALYKSDSAASAGAQRQAILRAATREKLGE